MLETQGWRERQENQQIGARVVPGGVRRRGAVIVLVAVFMVVLLGFAALVIDLGALYMTRTELQAAADAAAMAGASAYLTDDGLIQDYYGLATIVSQRAADIADLNETYLGSTHVAPGDILLGTHDFANPLSALDTSGINRLNAAAVTLRYDSSGLNGSIAYSFARLFGKFEGGMTASATAAIDDRFAEYHVDSNGVLSPLTIHEDTHAQMLQNGADEYTFAGGAAGTGSDGVREIKLFPWKLSGNGNGNGNGNGSTSTSDAGAGNFGTLNIGISNQGTAQLEDQILYGVTPAQIAAEIGTENVVFYDDAGAAMTHNITGNPGLSAGLADSVEARIGDVIGYFLHRTVSGQGANSVYEIVGLRFGRVMHIDLTGNPNDKVLVVQPVAYTGEGIVVRDTAPSTAGEVALIVLVQ